MHGLPQCRCPHANQGLSHRSSFQRGPLLREFAKKQQLSPPRQATHQQQHQWSSGVGIEPLHALLGLEKSHGKPTQSEAELSKAYRRLVASLHPDVNRSKAAIQKFKAVNQAYQVLKTPELRARAEQQGLKSLGPKFALLFQYLIDHSLADLGQGQRGGDLFTVVGLDLREASTGVETVVTVSAQGTCGACKGSGVVAHQSEDCDVCHGSGEILRTRYDHTGFKALHVGVCPACGGQGAKARLLCSCCRGEGRTSVRKRIPVKVPAGMDERRVLRLKGMGNAGVAGGPNGDLVLRFQIHATPNLERRGMDLHSELQLCCTSAVLGTIVPVSSVRGLKNLYIPQGTQDGAVICLQGCGLAYAEKGVVRHGHHYFRISLTVPDGGAASPEAQQLLRQLRQLSLRAERQRSCQQQDPRYDHEKEQSQYQDGALQQDSRHDHEQQLGRAQQQDGAQQQNDEPQHSCQQQDPQHDHEQQQDQAQQQGGMQASGAYQEEGQGGSRDKRHQGRLQATGAHGERQGGASSSRGTRPQGQGDQGQQKSGGQGQQVRQGEDEQGQQWAGQQLHGRQLVGHSGSGGDTVYRYKRVKAGSRTSDMSNNNVRSTKSSSRNSSTTSNNCSSASDDSNSTTTTSSSSSSSSSKSGRGFSKRVKSGSVGM